MQTLSMSLWSLLCFSRFYLAHHEVFLKLINIKKYKLTFALLFLCSLRVLLAHQSCTQGQLTLGTVTSNTIYLWLFPALQLFLPSTPTPLGICCILGHPFLKMLSPEEAQHFPVLFS